jgi:hypothetical protein
MAFHRRVEMGIGRDEFFRVLPTAVGPFDADGDTARWSDGRRRWVVRLIRQPERRLGSVTMPVCHVEIDLEAYASDEAAVFMARFERAYLRGGG